MIFEPIRKAARIVAAGGVVAYPTEGVYGLGCLPDALDAAARILGIKQRRANAGMLLIAASAEQLEPWVADTVDTAALSSDAEHPVTWIVDAGVNVPFWVTGDHDGVAVRISRHPVASALCRAAGSALISTSANVSGRAPARNIHVLRRHFRGLVDAFVPGRCGPARGPSEIRVLATGEILRPAAA